MSFEYLTEEQIDSGEYTPQYVIDLTNRCRKLEEVYRIAKWVLTQPERKERLHSLRHACIDVDGNKGRF